MKKWLAIGFAGWMVLCCAGTAMATNYALCVGLNTYSSSYISNNDLTGCVPDARNVYTNLTQRGEWTTSTATKFENSAGTKTAISNKIASIASTAVSGDVFVYYHSSHGYQISGKNTGICTYNDDLDDSVFAGYLAAFRSGVKVIVVLDTCHSGGMFKSITRTAKDGSTTTTDVGAFSPMAFAAAVNAAIDETRAAERAKGIKTAKLASSEIGWVTAADYNQYSWDGDTGGAFTECYIGSLGSGACDRSPYGDGDGYGTFLEMFEYAVEQDATHGDGNPSSEDYTMPQCTNTTVLASVVFGWVGDEEPSGVRFAPIPAQTMVVGGTLNYTLVATNSDGSTGAITVSVKNSTAPAGTYSLNASTKAFSFTPTVDGDYTFNFLATNATARTDGSASMSVIATLAAPTLRPASDIAQNHFTINWNAVTGAEHYLLDVATADTFSTGGTGELISEGFAGGSTLPEGWTLDGGPISTYTSTGNFGVTSPSLKLDKTATLTTPELSGPTNITFWLKGNGTTMTSTLVPEQLLGGVWTAVGTETIPTTATTVSYALDPSATQVRFVFTKVVGNAGLDDVLIQGVTGDSTLVVHDQSVSNTSYSVTGLEEGRTYYYRVRAVANAQSEWSATGEAATIIDPTAPPTLFQQEEMNTLVGTPATAIIQWGAPDEGGTVALSLEGDASATLAQDGAFAFPAAAAGVYSFTVTAQNNNGSDTMTFTVNVGLATPVASAATGVDFNAFTANWSAVAGATNYTLDVTQNGTSVAGWPKSVGNVTRYDVTGLTASTVYAYTVKATAGIIVSATSEEIRLTTSAAPAAPAFLPIPNQTAYVDRAFSIDIAAFATGSPTPVITMTDGLGVFDGTTLSFTSTEEETRTFRFQATNRLGSATAELTVTVTATLPAVKYALCVGINEYVEISSLSGCVNDAEHFQENLVARGGWDAANMTVLADSMATKNGIRTAMSNYAARAVAGDTFIYQHSSHGGQIGSGFDTYLCVYDEIYDDDATAYNDWELAADLQKFAAGVKVVVIVDACHSGGLFLRAKDGRATRSAVTGEWNFAERVTERIRADRAARVARGEKGLAQTLSEAEIGWVTAARYDESSYDGGTYADNDDTGGEFMCAAVNGWQDGTCDNATYGNQDGYANFYELWNYGYAICAAQSFYPQHTNDNVLSSVDAGWVGDIPPGIRIHAMPAQTVNVGTLVSQLVTAENTDGSVGVISFSLEASTAPDGTYTFAADTISFTPATDGDFTFTVLATNAVSGKSASATWTVTATLAAPTGLNATGIGQDTFTANWSAVPGAVSYLLDVASAATFSPGGNGEQVHEGFDGGTDLPDGWELVNGGFGGVYISDGNFGAASPSLKLSKNAVFTTPALIGPTNVSFWIKAQGSSPTSTLLIEQQVGSDWVTVATDSLPSEGTTISHALDPMATQVRFTFTKVVANASFDDVLIQGATGESTLVLTGQSVNGTAYTVTGLAVDTPYYYRVKAVGNATGPISTTAEVITVADPSAPPALRQQEDLTTTAGTPATATIQWSAPDEGGTVALSLEGDVSATLTQDGAFAFPATAAGVYSFTVTAQNNNGSDTMTFGVTVGLDAPTASAASSVGSDSFTANWSAVPGATGYILNVVEGTGSTPPPVGEGGVVVSNDFSGADTTSSTAISDFSAVGMEDWSGSKIYPNSGMLKGGSSSALGELFTPTVDMSGTVTVAFDAKSYNTTDGTILVVGISTDGGSTYVNSNVTLAATMESYSLTFEGGASAYVRFAGSRASKQRFYIDNVVITASGVTRAPRAEGDVVFNQNVGNVTSHNVTGLAPLTGYSYTVAAVGGGVTSAVSASISLTTTDGPASPVWSEIPEQSATVDQLFSFDLAAYITGSPSPAISLTSGTAELSGTTLSFTPEAAQTYSFGLSASNESGTASATLTVVAASGPVIVPTLSSSDITDTGFTASWTACTGATGYQIQIATDDTFSTGGGGGGGEGSVVVSNDFSGVTVSNSTAISDFAAVGMEGWSGSKIYPNSGMLKGGSSKDLGELFTPTVDMSGTVTVAFDAKSYNTTDGTILVVGISTDGGSTYVNSNVTLAATMESYSLTFEGGASAYVHFAGSNASKQRFYIDNVVITASGVTRAAGDGSIVVDTTVTETSYAATGLTAETTYYVRVRMTDGEWSAVMQLTTTGGEPPAGDGPVLGADVPLIFEADDLAIDLSDSTFTNARAVYATELDADGNWAFTNTAEVVESGGIWQIQYPEGAKEAIFRIILSN